MINDTVPAAAEQAGEASIGKVVRAVKYKRAAKDGERSHQSGSGT